MGLITSSELYITLGSSKYFDQVKACSMFDLIRIMTIKNGIRRRSYNTEDAQLKSTHDN